jgi:hypothetical protein
VYNALSSESNRLGFIKVQENTRSGDYEVSQLERLSENAQAADITSCGIKPSPECAESVFGDSDVEFSETFLEIMETTGRTFNTPSAVLVAYMASIHSLGKFSYLFSVEGEEELKKSYHWGGQIRGCDELDPMEQGPYDWIWNWFAGTLESGGAAEYLDALSEGRSSAASRCNFIDASFVAASHFDQSEGSGCNATWNDLIDELKSLTWGTGELEESYAEDQRYDYGGSVWEVFNNCRP